MEEDNSNQILRYLFRPRLPMIPLLAGTVLAVWQNITIVGLLNFAIYIKLSFVIAAIIVMGGLEKDGKGRFFQWLVSLAFLLTIFLFPYSESIFFFFASLLFIAFPRGFYRNIKEKNKCMATIVCIILLVTIGAMWSYISIQTLRQAYATHFFSNLTLNHVESIKFFSSQHEIVYTKAEKLSNLISKWKLYHYASNAHRYQPRFILQEHNPFNCVITLTDGQEYEFVVALGLPGKADTVYLKLVKPYKNMFFYRITSREYQSPSLYPILQNISNKLDQ